MILGSAPTTAAPQSRGSGRRRGSASGLLTALLVVIVLCLALLALPRLLGYGTLVVRSGSMAETAPVGSLVVARPLNTRDVRVGDVILVRREGATASAPVLHRVVTLTHRSGEVVVTTKGDSNATPDPTPYLLRGRTMTPVLAVPYLGRVFAAVHTRLGWMLLIGLPATVLLWVQLRTIWSPSRRRHAHRSQAVRFPRRRREGSQMTSEHAPATE